MIIVIIRTKISETQIRERAIGPFSSNSEADRWIDAFLTFTTSSVPGPTPDVRRIVVQNPQLIMNELRGASPGISFTDAR